MTTKEMSQNSKYLTIRVAFLLLTLVFVLSLLCFLWLFKSTHDLAEDTASLGRANHDLLIKSQKRDKQYREDSVVLCRKNIEGVRQVFKPFFPPKPLTLEQKAAITKFNRRVNLLKNGCNKPNKPNKPNK